MAQMTASSNKSNNLHTVEKLIKEASQNNAKVVAIFRQIFRNSTKLLLFQMIFLPEACDYIAESHSQLLELAEDVNGPLVASYGQLARTYNIWISIGGFHNRVNLFHDRVFSTERVNLSMTFSSLV